MGTIVGQCRAWDLGWTGHNPPFWAPSCPIIQKGVTNKWHLRQPWYNTFSWDSCFYRKHRNIPMSQWAADETPINLEVQWATSPWRTSRRPSCPLSALPSKRIWRKLSSPPLAIDLIESRRDLVTLPSCRRWSPTFERQQQTPARGWMTSSRSPFQRWQGTSRTWRRH